MDDQAITILDIRVNLHLGNHQQSREKNIKLQSSFLIRPVSLSAIERKKYTQAPITGRPFIETRKTSFTLYRPNSISGQYYKFDIRPDIEFDSITGGRLSGPEFELQYDSP